MSGFAKLFFFIFFIENNFATTLCFQKAKTEGKEGEIQLSIVRKMAEIVSEDFIDDDYELVSLQNDNFIYSLDHNNFNYVSFYSPAQNFGKINATE